MLKATQNALMLKHRTFVEQDQEGVGVRLLFPQSLDAKRPTFYLDLQVSPTQELTEFSQYRICYSESD